MLVQDSEVRCKKCGGSCRLTVGGVAIYFYCLESDCLYMWHDDLPVKIEVENETKN
jgi:hypothetical protein